MGLIGEVLESLGVLDPAERVSIDRSRPGTTRFVSRLLLGGVADEGRLVRGLALQQGVPGVDLSRSVLDPAALALIPEMIARENGVLPLKVDDEHLWLGMINPHDQRLVDEISFVTGRTVLPHVAIEASLRDVLAPAYAAATAGGVCWAGPEATGTVPWVAAVTPGDPPPLVVDDPPDLEVEVVTLPEAEVPGPSGPRVLVVDDEAEIRELLETALTSAGFQVRTAATGGEALRLIKTWAPQTLLLDAMLPEVHGFEICRRVRSSRRFRTLPVIIISAVYRGWRYAQDVQDAYGATDFIEKPFRLRDVVSRVRASLEVADEAPVAPAEAQARAEAAYRAGVDALRGGRLSEAVKTFRAGLQDDPLSTALHYSLGRALEAQGEVHGAMAAYERAAELKPELFPALRRLGTLYESTGFRRKAIEAWERALSVAPDPANRQLARESLLGLLERRRVLATG